MRYWRNTIQVFSLFLLFIFIKLHQFPYLDLEQLSGCFHQLSQLENLERLEMMGLTRVTDDDLLGFFNLRELHCQDCRRIGNRGIISLIKWAPNLSKLRVDGPLITDNFLRDVNDVMAEHRKSGVRLHLYLHSEAEDWEQPLNLSPLLMLSYTWWIVITNFCAFFLKFWQINQMAEKKAEKRGKFVNLWWKAKTLYDLIDCISTFRRRVNLKNVIFFLSIQWIFLHKSVKCRVFPYISF